MTDPGDDSDAVPFTAVRRPVMVEPEPETEETPIVRSSPVPFVFTKLKFYLLVGLLVMSIIMAIAFVVSIQLMSIKINSDRHRIPELLADYEPTHGRLVVLSIVDDVPAWVWIAANETTTP